MDTEKTERLLRAMAELEKSSRDEYTVEDDYAPTPTCPAPKIVRSVWSGQRQWTTAEEEHIKHCGYCRAFIPWLQKSMSMFPATEVQGISHKVQKPAERKSQVVKPRLKWHEALLGGGTWPRLAFVPALLLLLAFLGFRVLNQKQDGTNRVLVAEVPSELRSVARSADTTATTYPVGLTPVATAVRDGRPVFRWRGVDGTEDYRIKIWAIAVPKDNLVAEVPVQGNTWQPPKNKPLAPGLYRWKVNWDDKSSKWIGASFRVLKPKEAAEVAELEQRYSGNDEALAELYLKNNLFADAYAPLKRIYERTNDARLMTSLKIAARAAGQPANN